MNKKIIFISTLSFLLNSCHVARFFAWNIVDHDDYKKFSKVEITKGKNSFYFSNNTQNNNFKLPKKVISKKKETYSFNEALTKDKTAAFLIIKKDSILYEKYFDGFDKSSLLASFSVSKSFLATMIGIAINDGEINSVKDSITAYLPDLDKTKFGHINIENLLNMRSGIKSKKDFLNPFGQIVKMYYGKNLRKYMRKIKIEKEPGLSYDYSNVNSQLLAIILENATGKSVEKNLEEKIWKPLGMEYNATWSVDSKKNKMVKAFCCINASARDYAKIGRLYLNKGKWNNKQIIPENWVTKSTTFTTSKNDFRYTYHWKHSVTYEILTDSTKYPDLYVDGGYFMDKNNAKKDFIIYPYPGFFAIGILGQFVYVYPEKDLIIVRLGQQDKVFEWENIIKEIVELN